MGDQFRDVVFRLNGKLASVWAETNPILDKREPGFETDTRYLKIGDGFSRYNDLPYVVGPGVGSTSALEEHIASSTPHPVYDEGPSFALLYENAKV